MKLVNVYEGRVVVSTVEIAKHFEKQHKDILKAIRNLECSKEFVERNYSPISYQDSNNRIQPCYLLTKDGFAFLVMGFTGKKAAEWKEKYIKAFNLMEKRLLKEKDNEEWKQARLNSKGVRKSFTDTIKEFVSYAESQGSTQAHFYYSNLTKMEYKALGLVDKFSNDKDFRNQLDLMELSFLVTAENICKLAIEEGMRRELTYKETYQLAKEHVMQYANLITKFKPISSAPQTAILIPTSK